jgi:hypothetical protein
MSERDLRGCGCVAWVIACIVFWLVVFALLRGVL